MMSEIVRLLSQVMEDVGAVKKGDRNQHQNFSFRGIDAVLNAVSPALRKHGVIVTPQVLDYQYDTITVGNPPKAMGHVRVMVRYTFYGPDGSSLETVTPGESFDSGDKATAKAMSVAFRTCLIQALCLPTDETDPDAQTYERSASKASHPANPRPVSPAKPSQAVSETTQDVVVPISGGGASQKQLGAIKAILRELDMTGDTAKTFISSTINREVGSVSELTIREASEVIKALKEAQGGE